VLDLVFALALAVGAYGFGLVARFIVRNLDDWWKPEKWMVDPLLSFFLVPTFAGRMMLGLDAPGRAASLSEAAAAAFVSLGLFAATGVVLVI
jgi:hypothetical protein